MTAPSPTAPSRPGPPPPAGDPTDVVLAVDIGGTKFAAALVAVDGTILEHRQCPTNQDGRDAGGLFDALWGLAADLLEVRAASGGREPIACGVGSGGPMRGGGAAVSPLNIVVWRDFPLLGRLRERLAIPVAIDNDAKALALGEGWRGAAQGCTDYLAMVVSTGVGGGIVLDGRLLDGDDGNAGHIGHLTVDPDGNRCACGNRGCLEAEASGTAIEAITGRPAREAGPATVERAGTMVGRAVAGVATLLDLQLAVVAGSVALGFGEPFFAAAQAEIAHRARLDYASGCVIRPAGLGADGPLVGAAAVGLRAIGHDVGVG